MEGKYVLIKLDIPRDDDRFSCEIIQLVAFDVWWIANKNASLGPRMKFGSM